MPHIQLLEIQDESRREATMIRIRGKISTKQMEDDDMKFEGMTPE